MNNTRFERSNLSSAPRRPRGREGRGVVRVLLVLVCALLVPHKRVSAQSTARCDQAERVRSIGIEGSEIQTDELLTVLATTGPSFFTRVFGIGSAPCVDSLEVERDGLRIAVLHRQRGWFSAAVRPVLNREAKGTRVRFLVTPGPVARLRTVAVTGLPDSGANGTALDEPLTSLKGEVFDRVRVQQATDRVLARLQDAGYARSAQPVSTATVDTAAALVDLSVAFEPGVPLRTGNILIDIAPVARREPRYDSADVLRMSGLQSGERYRAVNVLDAQRALYRTDAFRLVLIDTVTPVATSPDSTIDLRISVAEARTRSARVGIGWGTLECGRVQGRITDRGFLGPGRRVEFVARASRVGIGRPLDQWPGLCPQFLRDDPYSQELNYYVGVSLGNSTFFGADLSPTIDVYSERRGEFNAFQLETDIGLGFALSKSLGRRTSATIGAEYESGRIVTDAVLACVRFALCQPADFALARQGNTTRAITASWFHDRVDNVTDPSRGGRLRADWRLGLTSFADLQDSAERRQAYAFSRPTLDATGFIPLGDGTIAARVQWSQVFAPNAIQIAGAPFLPPQERLFSGGQNTVRGYQQNLLGPVVYRVDRSGVDSVAFGNSYQLVVRPDAAVRLPSPEGGTGSVVANLEYRRRFVWPTRDLQWVAFVDAGTVWASGVSAFSVREIRTTPGIGVRLDTPLGPFRVDIGYNPLRADAGKAFLFDLVDTRRDGTGVPYVVCVSPGQEIEFDEQIASGGLACPRTFRPAAGRSTLSRLVFHFSLGQAF